MGNAEEDIKVNGIIVNNIRYADDTILIGLICWEKSRILVKIQWMMVTLLQKIKEYLFRNKYN